MVQMRYFHPCGSFLGCVRNLICSFTFNLWRRFRVVCRGCWARSFQPVLKIYFVDFVLIVLGVEETVWPFETRYLVTAMVLMKTSCSEVLRLFYAVNEF